MYSLLVIVSIFSAKQFNNTKQHTQGSPEKEEFNFLEEPCYFGTVHLVVTVGTTRIFHIAVVYQHHGTLGHQYDIQPGPYSSQFVRSMNQLSWNAFTFMNISERLATNSNIHTRLHVVHGVWCHD